MASRRQQITAMIYDRRGRILSIGQNSYVKTHPLQAFHAKKVGCDHKVFLHAEIAAIARCTDIERAHKMVVVRHLRNGKTGYAKPCPVCESAIKATAIKQVEHT